MVCIVGLFRARIAIYGYVWFALMQPDVLAWCEGKYPFSTMLAVAVLVGSIPHLSRLPSLFRNPTTRLLLLLQVPLTLSMIFCEGTFLAADRYVEYTKTILVLLMIPIVIRTEKELKTLLIVMAFSMGLFGARFGFYGLRSGGALFNQTYGKQYDNNTMGLALALVIPLCWFCRYLVQSRWIRMALLGTMTASTAAMIMTNSRGASLAAAAAFVVMIARSKHRVGVLIAVVLTIGPAIYMVKDQYFNRMSTLSNYDEDASAEGRLTQWKVTLQMIKDYPFLGVGFGSRNYIVVSQRYLKRENDIGAHNTYLQMMSDSGIPALLIYSMLLFGTIIWLGGSAKRIREIHPGSEFIPIALQASLIAFAVGGTFGSFQRYDFSYILLMSAASWRIVSETISEDPPEEAETPEDEIGSLAGAEAS
jgi:putative inorganic carbon (HCO3(-)) transporter